MHAFFFYSFVPMLLPLDDVDQVELSMVPGDRIYFYGDLGAGKTTLIRSLLHRLLGPDMIIQSPTYTYYQRYGDIVHCDLYRLTDYDTFMAIGGEEVFDDPTTICLVEWPELIEHRYPPTVCVRLATLHDRDDVRDITVERPA